MTLDEALEVLWEAVDRRGQNRVADAIPVARGTISKWRKGQRPEGETKERVIAYAETVVRSRAVRESQAVYEAVDPVDAVVKDGQRELAQWAQRFASRLLVASAKRIEAMPLPDDLDGLDAAEAEADADDDLREATPPAAIQSRPQRKARG